MHGSGYSGRRTSWNLAHEGMPRPLAFPRGCSGNKGSRRLWTRRSARSIGFRADSFASERAGSNPSLGFRTRKARALGRATLRLLRRRAPGSLLRGDGLDDETVHAVLLERNLRPLERDPDQRADLGPIDRRVVLEADVAYDVPAAPQDHLRIGQLRTLEEAQREALRL